MLLDQVVKKAAKRRSKGLLFVEPWHMMIISRDLSREHWQLFWLMAQLSDMGNMVRVTGRQMAKVMGVTETSVYRRLKKLRDAGLIVGTAGGYLVNGRFVWRGRLDDLHAHLDEFDEAQHRKGIASSLPQGGDEDAGPEGLEDGGPGRPAAGAGPAEVGDGGPELPDPGDEAGQEPGGGVALPGAGGRGPGSGGDLPGGAWVPAPLDGDEVATGEHDL